MPAVRVPRYAPPGPTTRTGPPATPGAAGEDASIAEPEGPSWSSTGTPSTGTEAGAPNPPSQPASVCLRQRRQTFKLGSGVSCRRIHECHPRRHFQGLLMSSHVTPVRADKADTDLASTGELATAVPDGRRTGRASGGQGLRPHDPEQAFPPGRYKKASSSPAGQYPASILIGASSTSNQWVVPMGMCAKSPSASVNVRSSTWTTGWPCST